MATENSTTETDELDFGPAITDEEVQQLEQHAQLPEMGVSRRIALAMLARDRDTIAGIFREVPDAGFGALEGLVGFYRHISSVQSFTQKAILRMVLAIQTIDKLDCKNISDEESMEIFNEAIEIALLPIEADEEAE